MSVTAGACAHISSLPIGQIVDFHPVLQVTSITSAGVGRYRLGLTDGTNEVHGMLATQLSAMVANDEIQSTSVVRMTSFIVNEVAGNRYAKLLIL